jgi:hypothetical protein
MLTLLSVLDGPDHPGLGLDLDVTTGVWRWLSKSGITASKRLGRLTLNSRGRGAVRLGKGWSCRIRREGLTRLPTPSHRGVVRHAAAPRRGA